MYLWAMEAVIYARISRDVAGEALGVQRQEDDCRAKAKDMGWTVAHVYVDNDVSASKAVPRPQYSAMLDGIKAGTIKALVVYDLDRLTRKPAELESFIDLVNAHGVQLANVSGDVDLTTANGKMIARIKGAVARQEADRISERTKRQKQQRISQGKPLGQRFRTFGYTRTWEVVEEEAAVVREVFKRALSGESQNGITRDLINRGIKTAAGNEWTPLQTSRLLKTHKYAGLQTYQGKVVGKSEVPALIDEATFNAVQGKAQGASFNFRKYLLSGILVCDVCKTPMTGTRVVNKGTESVRYRCDTRSGGCGAVSIKGEWIDGMVNRYMAWAVLKDRQEGVTAAPDVEDNSAAIAELDARIEDLRTGMGDGRYDIGDAMAAIQAARKARTALTKADAIAVAQTAQTNPIDDYDALTPDEQRVAIRRWFKFIFVKPGRRVRYFDETRIYALMGDGTLKAGGAINVSDYRDVFNPDVPNPVDQPYDPARGF